MMTPVFDSYAALFQFREPLLPLLKGDRLTLKDPLQAALRTADCEHTIALWALKMRPWQRSSRLLYSSEKSSFPNGGMEGTMPSVYAIENEFHSDPIVRVTVRDKCRVDGEIEWYIPSFNVE